MAKETRYNDLPQEDKQELIKGFTSLPPTNDIIEKTLQQVNPVVNGKVFSFFINSNETRKFVNCLLKNWEKELDKPTIKTLKTSSNETK